MFKIAKSQPPWNVWSHKEWHLNSNAVVSSFVGIGRGGRRKDVHGQTSSTKHPGVVRQPLTKDGRSLIISYIESVSHDMYSL